MDDGTRGQKRGRKADQQLQEQPALQLPLDDVSADDNGGRQPDRLLPGKAIGIDPGFRNLAVVALERQEPDLWQYCHDVSQVHDICTSNTHAICQELIRCMLEPMEAFQPTDVYLEKQFQAMRSDKASTRGLGLKLLEVEHCLVAFFAFYFPATTVHLVRPASMPFKKGTYRANKHASLQFVADRTIGAKPSFLLKNHHLCDAIACVLTSTEAAQIKF